MTATAAGERRSIEVDGATISYLRAGSGPPVLFLHGAGGVAGWMPWMDAFAERYDLIVPDHPGWGRSDVPDWFDNIHDLAYFHLDFIAALGLERVHLAGSSIGGWIACEMAIRNTNRLASLTLIDSAGLRVKGLDRFDIFLASPEENIRAVYYDQAIADRILAQPIAGDALDTFLKNRYATARVAWQPRLFDPHLAKWLHRIDVPALVAWGAEDRIFPVAMLDEFVRLIPGAQALTIPQCGHLPHIECTQTLLDRFNRFTAGARA